MNNDDPHHPGPATVLIDNRQDEPVDVDTLRGLALTCLAGEGVTSGELSVSFVDRDEMEDLHVRYLGEDGPTDVLSCPQDDVHLLGDVVICPEVAAGQALRLGHEPAAELELLVAHGLLHLLGHDHAEPDERTRMFALTDRLLAEFRTGEVVTS